MSRLWLLSFLCLLFAVSTRAHVGQDSFQGNDRLSFSEFVGFASFLDSSSLVDSFLSSVSLDSLSASTYNDIPERAATITAFTISDLGADRKPTVVSRILLDMNAHKVSVSKVVAGTVVCCNGRKVDSRIAFITDKYLVVELLNGNLLIADSTSSNVTVGIYVNPAEVLDLSSISFKIKGVDVDTAFSCLEPFSPVQTNVLLFKVKADRFIFSKIQSPIKVNSPFDLSVKACDSYENTDVDFNGECSLTVSGPVSMMLKTSFITGVAKYSSLSFSKSGRYEIVAAGARLSSTKELIVADNDSYLKAVTPDCSIPSIAAPLRFFDLLKFKIVDSGVTDTLKTEISQLVLNALDTAGNLLGRRVVDSLCVYFNGVRVDAKYTFYSTGKILISIPDGEMSVLNGTEAEVVIRVKLLKNYFTSLFYFSIPPNGVEVGLASSFLSTLYNYHIRTPNLGVTSSDFRILEGRLSSKGRVQLRLNQQLEPLSNISIKVLDDLGNDVKVNDVTLLDPFILSFKVAEGKTLLRVLLRRVVKEKVEVDSVLIRLKVGLEFGDATISEIMPDPLPSLGLPEGEYLEVYNRLSDTLDLEGWTVSVNGRLSRCGKGVVLPYSYAVLSSTSVSPFFKGYGNVVSLSNFDGLPNEGAGIHLINQEGTLIATAFYTDDLYQQEDIDGGVSLERIDVNSFAESIEAWGLSRSSNGGTPCNENSIAGTVVDKVPPRVEVLKVEGVNRITIVFNEPIELSQRMVITLNGLLDKATYSFDLFNPKVLFVKTSAELLRGEINRLKLLGVSDHSGNSFADEIFVVLGGSLHRGSLLINEVLFNPDVNCSDYVEVVNTSSTPLNLGSVSLARRNPEGKLEGVIRFSKSYKILQPNEYAVVCETPDALASRYLVSNPSKFLKVGTLPSFPNGEGTVVLADSVGNIVDEFYYSEDMHFKMLPTFKGVALERLSIKGSQWMSASKEVGYGTPGMPNSQQTHDDVAEKGFSLLSNSISPDGDGTNDFLSIAYRQMESGSMVDVTIFSIAGIPVRRLCRNELLGTSGTIVWDGITDAGLRVSRGIYIAHVQTTFSGGRCASERLVFSVAYR
jgi:hypothetical protein